MARFAPPDLWEIAANSIDIQVKDRLAPTKTLVRDIVYEVLEEAKARHNDSVKKRLRLPNGIIVRDVMEKIMHWANCFKEVGDNAVQFEPGHAALPWAAVRFVLQALVNYGEVERELLEEIELIARLLAIFRGIEKSYLGPDAMVELQDALVRAYIAILEILANAVKMLGESKKAKLLKAPFRVLDGKNISRLLTQEREVFSFTQLVDGDRVSQMMMKLERLIEWSTITDIAVKNEKHKAVLEWLSKTNYRDHHRDLGGMRLSGTGDWLLQHAEYIAWQQRSSCSTLMVHGIPGCGKTILCSTVIDELMQSSSSTQSASSTQVRAPVAFFYCSAIASEPDRRDFTNILRSLLRQLAIERLQAQRIHSAVLAAYDARFEEAKKDGFDIRPLDAAECETMILDFLEDNPATFIIDAIDEIDDPQGLLQSLQTICSKSKNILKILVSSRDNPLILSTSLAAHHIRVTTKDNHSDVHKFITQRVDRLIERRKMPQNMRDETILSLSTRAGEMFQWAKLQLAQLEYSQDPLIGNDFREKLCELATSTLEGLYGTIFGAIMEYKETARQMATHTFSWLLFACEPLSVNMLLAATADASGWGTPTPEGFLKICRGFVYVDSQSNIVRLVHESVREFLLSQPLLQPQMCRTLISLSCLNILEDPPPDDVTQLNAADEPYDYATLYCGQHLSQASADPVSDVFSRKVQMFFFDGQDVSIYADIWLTTVKNICNSLPHDHSERVAMGVIVSDSCSPIFPICAFGLLFVLETHHWPVGHDWNQANSQNHTALYLAANFGHADVVSFLLDRNADPDVKCGIFGNALQCAAYRGHDNVVEVLVDRGADLNLSGKFESVLHAACSGGHENVALKLLDSRLKFTTQSEYGVAITEFARAGFARVLDKLQSHPLSNTLTSDKIQQQARAAIISGKLPVLKRLISRSSFNLVVIKGSLALSAVHGRDDIAELLIAHGVDVDEPGHLGTPLRCASVCGHNNVCRILLDHGADANANARFGTALHAAAMRGHLHTAKFLLDNGANVNAQGGHYGTPMQAAAYHGHVELVNLFLDAKADILIPGLYQDAFRAAIEGGRLNVVQTFMDAGLQRLKANCMDSMPDSWAVRRSTGLPARNILRDSSPAWRAIRHAAKTTRHDDVTNEQTADANMDLDPFDPAPAPCSHKIRRGRRRSSWSPRHPGHDMLETAAALGHLAIVRKLLSEGSFFGDSEIALVSACRHGQPDVVRALIDSIPVNSDCMRNSFAAASVHQDDEIMQILMSALDKLEERERAQFLHTTLEKAVPDDSFLFGHALRRLVADTPEHHSKSTLTTCLSRVAEAGWTENLQIILENLPDRTIEDTVMAFEAAFDAGHATTVLMLQKCLTEEDMTAQQYNGFARLAAQGGHAELLECLLPQTDFFGAKQSFDYMLYCAAGSGSLRIVTTLTSEDWTCFYDKVALTKALLVSARHGHCDVSSFLVSKGAEVCQSVIEVSHRDVLETKASVYRYLESWEESSLTGDKRRHYRRNARRSRLSFGTSENAYEEGADAVPEQHCNSIEACLAGYERFSVYDGYPNGTMSPWHPADEAEHARTLLMLFDRCTGFRGPQWAHIVCKASAICPPEMLDMILAKGADPCATIDTTSALICAAGRSTSTLGAVQALVSAASDTAFGENELRRALNATVSLFAEGDDDASDASSDPECPGHRKSLFPMYDKIEEIFASGPGAVIEYMLHRLPQEITKGDGYSLCLQMAAAAGNYEIVRLLLEHGVDCDAVVGYYGTALKAACRFGHSATVTLLLDSGASHTISNGGAPYTALQAAVMARSLSCVQSLLDHGANVNATTSTRASLRFESSVKTALELAVDARLTSISVLLVEAGARVDEDGDSEQPILIKACSWGETIVLQSLLEVGAEDVKVLATGDSFTSGGPQQYASALHAVIEFGHVHLIELLVAHGLDVTADCGIAGSPLEYAASKADISVVATLLALSPHHCGRSFIKAAQGAISHSRQDVVRLICEHARGILIAGDVLLLCKTPGSSAQCSVVWYLLDRLRQLNGSARELAEAIRYVIQDAQPATASQLFIHAEKFLSSREIWNVLNQACLRAGRQFVVLLIEVLQGRHDFDLEREVASADITEMQPEHLGTLLSYVPCTDAMFEEACTKGYERIVRVGLAQGLASDDVDGMQRPVLHLAAAHERVAIVEMLLEERPRSYGRHRDYDTPMEAVLMSCAFGSSFFEKSRSKREAYLRCLTSRSSRTSYEMQSADNSQRTVACKDIIRLLLEHKSHLSTLEDASGSTFLELSLAAYLGWCDVLHQLLVQGTPVPSYKSTLLSPLLIAIDHDDDGDSLAMVKEMLEFDKSRPGASLYDPEGYALHQACRHARLPIVEVLLTRGYNFALKNGDAQSALTVCLEQLTHGHAVSRDASVAIAHTLLERDVEATVSAEDIVVACSIAVGAEQNAILETLFARWEPFHIPEEGVIRLLSAELPWHGSADTVMPWQKVLDERRIEKVTTNLFAGVDHVDVLTKLLDYDQSYVVCADTIDLVGTRLRGYHGQSLLTNNYDQSHIFGLDTIEFDEVPPCDSSGPSVLNCIKELLDRYPDLLPTGSNILRVLNVAASFDASHILNLLFTHNPALMVTEQMLRVCRSPANLRFLLSRAKTGGHGLILSLMDALVDGSEDLRFWEKRELSAKLAVLLDHVPRAKVPGNVVEYIMTSNHLGNIERVLDRDPDASLTGDSISASVSGSSDCGTSL